MSRKLTAAMRRALANIAAGRHIAHGISGTSAHGGMTQTIYALHRRGFLDRKGEITPAGRAILEAGDAE